MLCLPFESFPWVLFWQPFLLRAKDIVFRKPIPHSLFNMNNSRVMVQFQPSEKLFILITFSKFITSTEFCYWPMFASIHLHLKKVINLTQTKSRLERKVKFLCESKTIYQRTTPIKSVSNSPRLDQIREHQLGHLWIHSETSNLLKNKFYQKLPEDCSLIVLRDNKLHLSSLFLKNNLSYTRKASVTQFKTVTYPHIQIQNSLVTVLNFMWGLSSGSLLTITAAHKDTNIWQWLPVSMIKKRNFQARNKHSKMVWKRWALSHYLDNLKLPMAKITVFILENFITRRFLNL